MTDEMADKVTDKKEKGSRMVLSFFAQFAYSVGHVLNDLCAAMWFSYLLLFETLVLGLSSEVAGALMLIGQIADGIATPFIGYFSDRGDVFFCCKYGRRKSWHLLGTIGVLVSFPFIFSQCFGCEASDLWAKVLYYATFICLFQFGWAAVQVAHLAVVPELTPDDNERTLLFSYRYSFTVIASMAVYIMMWVALRANKKDIDRNIEPSDRESFQFVMLIVIIVGTLMTIIYHVGIPKETREDTLMAGEISPENRVTAFGIFTYAIFYKVAFVYMATRLYANMSQVLIPLYLQYSLTLPADSIASVPLTVFISSFLTSLITKPLNKSLGRKISFVLGSIIGLGAAVWVFFGKGPLYEVYLVNIVAALFGVGGSIMTVTSLGITADYIGQDYDNSAYIFGIMSFLDKLSNGATIMIVQTCGNLKSKMHYRDSLAIVCGLSAIVGMIAVLTFKKENQSLTSIAERKERSR